MQERLLGAVSNLRDRWTNLEKNQKIRLIVIVAVLIAVLGLTLFLSIRTNMELLVDNRDFTTTADMHKAVTDAGIRARIVNNGRGLEVDNKRITDAQVILAQRNLMSDSSGNLFTYADALSNSGMGTTETIKKENIKKVKESDLSLALRSFSGIDDAQVILTLPESSTYFINPVEEARATAKITTNSKTLDRNEGKAIATFIRASVKGLEMENIEIIDQNYNLVYSGYQESLGGVSNQYDQEIAQKNEMETKVKTLVSPLYSDVKVMANLKFDWNKTTERTKELSPPVSESETGVPLTESVETQSITGANAGGEPGLGANDQTTPTYQAGSQTGQSARINSRETDYGYNERETVSEVASGILLPEDSSISIIGYNYIMNDETVMKKANQLGDMTWEEFKNSIDEFSPITITPDIVNAISAATGLPIERISIIGYNKQVFVDAVPTPMNIQQIMIFVILALLILMLAYGIISKTKPAEITEVEPELSVEDLLVSTKIEEEKEEEAEKLKEIDYAKESEAKRQIEKFVAERPEAVTQLLRNWLNNEWE